MPATLYSADHERLIAMLRDYRKRAGLRQSELAARLGRPQSFVSKYESGQRRLDLIELDSICAQLGVNVTTLVRRWANRR